MFCLLRSYKVKKNLKSGSHLSHVIKLSITNNRKIHYFMSPDLLSYHLGNILAKYVKPNPIMGGQLDKSRKWDSGTDSWPGIKIINIMKHTKNKGNI